MTNGRKVSATACIGIPGKRNSAMGRPRRPAPSLPAAHRLELSPEPGMLKMVTSAIDEPAMAPTASRGTH